MARFLLFFLLPFSVFSQKTVASELLRWQKTAKNVVITRDIWGIPHIEGKTDADAVFGLLYAQCEDDFQRVEMNYIEKLGRLSEVNGEKYLYNDLQIRLLINETEAKKEFLKAEPWFKKLLIAYADGINYFLHKNTKIKPILLNKFEPWYPLLWTDGSIGAISTADLEISELQNLYGEGSQKVGFVNHKSEEYQQTGSNGFAIAPKLSSSGKAMLYINPHTTYYFRPEVHVKSLEGLNVYGAVTWGQFFVYQGFNEYCGWMHTSSNADVSDTYKEKIIQKNGKYFYEYDGKWSPLIEKIITIKFKDSNSVKSISITTFSTHHGPIMAKRGEEWLSLKSYNRSELGLKQSWIRTKAKGFEDYKKAMDLKANTSNNTVFADHKGNIAYWHGNYMPKRNPELNWSKAQDGSIKANEYQGLHTVEEIVHVYNPINGWLQNCNSTPFTAAGENSPSKMSYPPYMAPDGENFRGINAVRLLKDAKELDIDKLIKLGYDNYLPAFEILIPGLVLSAKNIENSDLKEAVAYLAKWDYRVNENSVEATLAIEWAQKLSTAIRKVYIDEGESDQIQSTKMYIQKATPDELLKPLAEVIYMLKNNFGTWKIAWGDINRFQRLNNKMLSEYDDVLPSLPVGNASALWGCLPSFNSSYFKGSKKRYGYSGNSFVCAVEFGEKVKAKSILAGGNSGDVNSKDFNNQGEMFTKGKFKDVLFYDEDIKKNAFKTYNPGE